MRKKINLISIVPRTKRERIKQGNMQKHQSVLWWKTLNSFQVRLRVNIIREHDSNQVSQCSLGDIMRDQEEE